MPDIAMCKQDKCKKRKTCYRYMAKPDNRWQSYIIVDDPKTCEHYWYYPKDSCEEEK